MDTETLKRWSTNSPLIAAREAVERRFGAAPRRPPTPAEIQRLEAQGNSAEAWDRLLVPDNLDTRTLHACRFEGRVELGAGVALWNSLLRDCRIDEGVSIRGCGLVERAFVAPGAVLEGVGRLALSGPSSSFGNRLELFALPLYSRAVRAVAELPFDWAVRATGPDAAGRRDGEFERNLRSAAGTYAQHFESTLAWVGPGVRIRATPIVENCWIGEGVDIDGAGSLRDSTIWADPGAPTILRDGAEVRGSLIGPGCLLQDQCLVRDSILIEEVSVGDQAILKGSLIGPNARLGECEVNDSLLGPFTTALHHSLVIAAWWPEGRGNVGYGANVGSNHTGRAPDQEIWPGEGVFFGLGCNIKLPANFREAPYSLIATGTDTLPQRVAFPFSLISKPARLPEGIERGLSEIQPGWSLLHNAYGLERQERNQIARQRARRTPVALGILRPDLAPLLESARLRLAEGARDATEDYTEREIDGLGKNFMSEESRRRGIEAYAFALGLIVSRRLIRALEAAGETPDRVAESAIAQAIRHAVPLLGSSEPEALLRAALSFEEDWTRRVIESKARDDARGGRTLDDYAERHLGGGRDPLIAGIREELDRRRDRIPAWVRVLRGLATGAPAGTV